MYVRRVYWLLCILGQAKRHGRVQMRQNIAICFYNIPNRGTKCSLVGNKVFPNWESIVPLLGTFFTCFDEDFVVLKM